MMIRLFLFLLMWGISNCSGITNEEFTVAGEVCVCSQSGLTAKYDIFNPLIILEGVNVTQGSASGFLPDIKKNLFSDSQKFEAIKIRNYTWFEAELHYLTRKDNLFLSILRI